MEAFGIMLTRDIKIYLYPYQSDTTKELLNSKNIPIHPRAKSIYNYVRGNKENLLQFLKNLESLEKG